VKNAGTCFRFLTSLFSITSGEFILTGSSEMKQRPIKELVKALKSIGAEIQYIEREGFPPLRIEGMRLVGGKVEVNSSISSQYVTAMLLVAPFLENGLEIEQKGEIKSKSYTDMTISLLKEIGVEVIENGRNIKVIPLKNPIVKKIKVESDWSSASYWYELISLSEKYSKIQIIGLKENSIQGDSVIQELFQQFGIHTYFGENGVEIIKTKDVEITNFEYNFSSIPDMVPTFVVTCVGLGINGKFSGISHLVYKETNRIEALKKEIKKLNYSLEMLDKDSFEIKKIGELPKKVKIKTYKDHRMAMSFAPLLAKLKEIEIEDKNVIVKSYPEFWEEFL
jgi:3-phosphoshikimate 1-carboxyvinyltransferase